MKAAARSRTRVRSKEYLEPESFEHVAFYDSERQRVEMHPRASRVVSARIDKLDLELLLEKGETIRTEISRKFTRPSFTEALVGTGLELSAWFTDSESLFASALVRPILESRSS